MSIFRKITDIARSQQGRKALEQAKRYARDPKNKERIDRVVNRVRGRGKGH
ncbi:hypothetical protein [Actinopolyspora mortivallis]|uniref:hypothetical protein n=1 Tax=Actinopolyspora mortivallis TaxID=33906 RepID=UPI00038081C4|nr:hypothetical protein [Actinopolyspora mortivallis]